MNDRDLEMYRTQAALGNPVAQNMVALAEGKARPSGKKAFVLPEHYASKYLPPTDPEAEAEVLREQEEAKLKDENARLKSLTPRIEASEFLGEAAEKLIKSMPPQLSGKTWPQVPPKEKEHPSERIQVCTLTDEQKREKLEKAKRNFFGKD